MAFPILLDIKDLILNTRHFETIRSILAFFKQIYIILIFIMFIIVCQLCLKNAWKSLMLHRIFIRVFLLNAGHSKTLFCVFILPPPSCTVKIYLYFQTPLLRISHHYSSVGLQLSVLDFKLLFYGVLDKCILSSKPLETVIGYLKPVIHLTEINSRVLKILLKCRFRRDLFHFHRNMSALNARISLNLFLY